MHQAVADFKPTVTVIDPVTNLMTVGTLADVQAMLTRLIDHLKTENITAMLTSLTPGTVDTRFDDLVTDGHVDRAGERERRRVYRRDLGVLKSRGMAHSNEIREFVLTDRGLHVLDPASEPRRHGHRGGRSWKDGLTMLEPSEAETFLLRLYVAGQTPRSAGCAGESEDDLRRQSPGALRAGGHRSAAEPCACQRRPDPGGTDARAPSAASIKKIIGDLSNRDRVLVGLDLRPR